jgi:hypothetical protein
MFFVKTLLIRKLRKKFRLFFRHKIPNTNNGIWDYLKPIKGLNTIVRVYSLVSSFISWLIFLSILNSLIPLPKPFINSGIFYLKSNNTTAKITRISVTPNFPTEAAHSTKTP